MLLRFAAATIVGAIVIALASVTLYLSAAPNLEGRYLVATIWCLVPVVWGLWAMAAPASWVPGRLPWWGATLGVVAGITVAYVVDIPAQVFDVSTSAGAKLGIVVLAVVLYGVLWIPVRSVYDGLGAGSAADA